jgi:hypothetical protein
MGGLTARPFLCPAHLLSFQLFKHHKGEIQEQRLAFAKGIALLAGNWRKNM